MARTYSGLYPNVCSFDNLVLALRKAAKGKRRDPEVGSLMLGAQASRLLFVP